MGNRLICAVCDELLIDIEIEIENERANTAKRDRDVELPPTPAEQVGGTVLRFRKPSTPRTQQGQSGLDLRKKAA